METIKKDKLTIVGITVRTTNENGKAAKDIPKLWDKFMKEDVRNKVINKVDESIYALYTDYESDHTQPYTTLIGYSVKNLDNIHEDLTVKMIPATTYAKYIAKGDLTKDAVYNEWLKIWDTDLERAYTADLEIYGEKAADPKNGEAEIYIALK
tara:strand:- start:3147 stop:3605 length:459 start_codon:yes stop_codon:yes gene_type:complete